jgi:hypothetical protein
MTFEEILDQAMAMLQRRGRVTYRTLKRQFNLDDEGLEDVKEALLYAHPHVADDPRPRLGLEGRDDVDTAYPFSSPTSSTACRPGRPLPPSRIVTN